MKVAKYLTFKSTFKVSKPEMLGFYMMEILTFDNLFTQSRQFFV